MACLGFSRIIEFEFQSSLVGQNKSCLHFKTLTHMIEVYQPWRSDRRRGSLPHTTHTQTYVHTTHIRTTYTHTTYTYTTNPQHTYTHMYIPIHTYTYTTNMPVYSVLQSFLLQFLCWYRDSLGSRVLSSVNLIQNQREMSPLYLLLQAMWNFSTICWIESGKSNLVWWWISVVSLALGKEGSSWRNPD